MGDFIGVRCPVCEKRFEEGEDVVVCPVCGTPYHRTCYQQAGRCINVELHERHEEWTPEGARVREEDRFDGDAHRRCAKCGTVNPADGIFCQICGYPLKEDVGEGGAPGPVPIAPNPYTTPYGGVSPDEEIDGVPVRDLALFVGENSHYFIPHFRDQFQNGRMAAWNWPAFLFRGFYFLYRKMYVAGAALLLLTLLLGLPGVCLNFGVLLGRATVLGLSLTLWNRAALACNALSLGLSLGCSFFSNRAYYRHALSRVKRLRAASGDLPDQEYVTALTRRGRTNRLVIIVLLCGFFVLSMALSFLMVMSVV